jgi:hypothetical protein
MVQISSDSKLSGGVQMLVGYNLNGDPVFRPTFKTTISGETYIYRYIGYRYSNKTQSFIGVYAIDSKRGIAQAAGKVVKEYGLPESIFDDNNITTVDEEEVREMEKNDYYKETKEGKLIYDYSGFHHVPSSMAIAVKGIYKDTLEEDTEGEVPGTALGAFSENVKDFPEGFGEKTPLTDIKQEAIKDNEQDYLHCKIG